jgi:transcriptional regulator with XRE-family HTH domain
MTSESSVVDQPTASHPLARLRADRGLSREVLGSLAGVSPRTIYGIELGGVQPQRATVRVLCLALGVEDSELFPDRWGGATRA